MSLRCCHLSLDSDISPGLGLSPPLPIALPLQVPDCCPGFFGTLCEPCPGGLGGVCSGHGQCQDRFLGNGECRCQEGFHGTACEMCELGRYGPTCSGGEVGTESEGGLWEGQQTGCHTIRSRRVALVISLSHFQYATVTTGCARRGCAAMEAVSVMWAGRVSAVTRVSGSQGTRGR